MKERKLVPKRRFEEFQKTDDWKQYKLIEVARYRNGKAHEKDVSEAGNFIVVNSKFVSTNGEIKKFTDKQIEPLEKNEIAFVLSDVPNGRAVARTYLVPVDNKYSLNQRIAGITPHDNTNPYFISELMNRHSYFLQFDDGVGQTNLSKKDVEDFEEFYPIFEEQQKIGNFFKHLDQMISLEQRKLEKTKALKSAYLAEMFPAEGERVPKRRFARFTGEWTEMKLKDISEIVGGGTPSSTKEEFWNGDIDWYSPTEIGNKVYANNSIRKITKMGYEKSSAKMLPADKTILFTSRAGIGSMAILKKQASTNQGFQSIVLKSGIDTYFIYSMGYLIKSYAISKSSGSTFLEISGKTLGEMPIVIPSFEEQLKIGEFFKKLDESISNHQQKLNKLQAMKQAYLEEMFV